MEEVAKAMKNVPEKTYYRIGEVAKITRVKPYVLRYWETEFKAMVPPKSSSNQRMYRRKDIERVLMIKHLLYKQRFTIEGARKRLNEILRGQESEPSALPDDLTDRELEVLAGIAEGKNNRTLAREFGISEATVKTHVSRVLTKLGVESRVQAALRYTSAR